MIRALLIAGGASAFQQATNGISKVSTALHARQPIMAGNWKLNPSSVQEADGLAKGMAALLDSSTCAVSDGPMCTEVVVFPPFPFIASVVDDLENVGVGVGAQSIFHQAETGAYTGAVSCAMVKDMGCMYVLCGHSERRTVFKDDDAAINSKVLKVIEDGLKPVLCIGETKDEYDKGLNKEVCAIQLAKGLSGVTAEEMADIVIAYEPVWAIGTGLTCPSEVAQEVHAFIRGWFDAAYSAKVADGVVIQYGGSVTPETVDELMAMPDIDGALVGGASLVAEKFSRIVGFTAKVSA